MDAYFVRYLLLDETTMVAVHIALIVTGGVAAALVLNVKTTLRRAPYCALYAGALLLLIATQLGWLLAPAAASKSVLWLVIIADLAPFLIYGAAIYAIAAARSNAISGKTRLAWLAYVPLLNLSLMLRSNAGPAPLRSGVSRFVGDPALILATLACLSAAKGFEALVNKAVENNPPSAALTTLLIQAQSVEEHFAQIVMATRPRLPGRLEEITSLTGIKARGKTLQYIYTLDQDIDPLDADFKARLTADLCSDPTILPSLTKGGHVLFTYNGPKGQLIDEIDVSFPECDSKGDA